MTKFRPLAAANALLSLALLAGCAQQHAGRATEKKAESLVQIVETKAEERQTIQLLPPPADMQSVAEAESAEPVPVDPLLAGINPEDLAKAQANAKIHYLKRWDAVAERSRLLRQRLLGSLQELDAPESLQIIPVVESTYNPYAFSRAGALGLWQLMPKTAHGLGIRPQKELDGRRHVEASTRAAATYLLKLHARFNSWPLAIAAYNLGPYALAKRLKRSPWKEADGLDNMPIPRATRIYVQHVIGLAALMHLDAFSLPEPIMMRQLTLQAPVDLQQLAESMGMERDWIFHLNPGLNQAQYLHGSITIAVPAAMYEQLQEHAALARPEYVQVTVQKAIPSG